MLSVLGTACLFIKWNNGVSHDWKHRHQSTESLILDVPARWLCGSRAWELIQMDAIVRRLATLSKKLINQKSHALLFQRHFNRNRVIHVRLRSFHAHQTDINRDGLHLTPLLPWNWGYIHIVVSTHGIATIELIGAQSPVPEIWDWNLRIRKSYLRIRKPQDYSAGIASKNPSQDMLTEKDRHQHELRLARGPSCGPGSEWI